MRCGAVVLAAGASRRLGAPKQLIEYGGRPLVVDAAVKARDAGCAPIVVVTGAYAEAVEAALTAIGGVHVARNERWEDGAGTSVAAGIRALRDIDDGLDAVLFMLCDQPLVPPAHLRALIDAARVGAADIVATRHADGAGGVPACFRSTCFDDLARLEGPAGARTIIADPKWSTSLLTSPAASFDIDTPEDVARLASAQPHPSPAMAANSAQRS